MNIKKILFALIVTSLLIGSACAAGINDFKVDGYTNTQHTDISSVFVNGNGDSGVTIHKNVNGIYHDDDGIYDDDGYDDDGYYDYDDDGIYDDDGYYDYDDDGYYDFDNDGLSDDMVLSKNADNTATFTDYDDAQHGAMEVVQIGGESYTVVFWAKDPSNIDSNALMTKLNDFNKDNGVAPVAF